MRKSAEIFKRAREVREKPGRGFYQRTIQTLKDRRNIKECVSDVPDYFATPEPASCQLVADYEKLAVLLERFPERTTRDGVISPIAARKLASLGCGAVAPPKPRETQIFRDCPKICPEMVVVPAGDFIMGSPDPDPERAKGEAKTGGFFLKPSLLEGSRDI